MNEQTGVTLEEPGQVVNTRLLAAPCDRVFAAFTRPEQLARWFGPSGFTLTTHEMEVRPGGIWRFTMHGPDGTDYGNRVEYLTVEPPSLLVYNQDDDSGGPPWFQVTISFEPRGERTLLTMRSQFPSSAARDEVVRSHGALEGARQTVDRLAAELTQLPHPRDFVITRDFDAARGQVWRAFTEPAQLVRWWGPRAFACAQCEFDARPDGAYRITMRGADGTDYPVRGRVVEIEAPSRLVTTMDCAEHPSAWHDMVKPGRAADDINPAGVMLQTVDFESLSPQRTRLTIRIRLHSVEMRDAMVNLGMNAGWSESLDRLGELLPAVPA